MDGIVILDLAGVAVLLAAAMWLARRTVRTGESEVERSPAEPAVDTALAAARVTVSWAAGSRADWDRHVRPVLAREFDAVAGGRRAGDRAGTGELMFGPELWRLVDSAAPFTTGQDLPGPGRAALDRILQRLEQDGRISEKAPS